MADDFNERLLAITKGCRHDMHEPDNQGLSARIVGDELDNAFGEQETAHMGFQEIVVILTREGAGEERFNLATLIALARVGAQASDLLNAARLLPVHWLESGVLESTRTDKVFIRMSIIGTDYEHTLNVGELRSAAAAIAKAECHP